MEVTQTVQASTVTPGMAKSGALSSDFETFLKMLTVQMQNQDPLNPIEASDYAVQLATFSNVEQSVKTNQLLEGLQGQFGLLSMAQLAGWVGQEARAGGPVQISGAPVTISPNPAASADRAVLVVKDAEGTVIAREEVPLSAENREWLPLAADGSALPPGKYVLSLESYRDGALLTTTDVEHYSRIVEAQGGPTGTVLVLAGGARVSATDITALRVPPPAP